MKPKRCAVRLAAEGGYANTQFSLAASFAEGLGVSQDDLQVYLWLTPAYITYRTADQREVVEWGALAIGTTGYDEDFWTDRRGLPTTEQLRTIGAAGSPRTRGFRWTTRMAWSASACSRQSPTKRRGFSFGS